MKIRSFSHKGKKSAQEDAFLIIPDNKVFVVCDGVGGSSNGALAAGFVIDFVIKNHKKYDLEIDMMVYDSKMALEQMSIEEGILTELSTTIVVAKITEDTIITTHLGDSKFIYISNNDTNKHYISKDHSLIEDLIAVGIVNSSSETSPYKKMITKCISNHLSFDLSELIIHTITKPTQGDCVILCSDGVLECINSADLIDLFASTDIELIEKRWDHLDNLCKNNARDNATCILIQL